MAAVETARALKAVSLAESEATDPEGRAVFMLVDPTRAATWLETANEGNRKVRQRRVDYYAQQMIQGRWKVVSNALGFDQSGRLIDGQHRLWAVVESGCAQWFWIIRNLGPGAFEVTDDNAPRQVFEVAPEWVTKSHAATARVMAQGREGLRSPVPISRPVMLEILEQHADVLMQTKLLFSGVGSTSGVSRGAVRGAFARALYHSTYAGLAPLAEVLRTGLLPPEPELSKALMVGHLLRNHLLIYGRRGGTNAALEDYGKTERAIQAWLKREHVSKLYASSEELFPLPQEKG